MMTDAALADYVRSLADRMLLRDWTIFVSSHPDEKPDDEGIDDPRCATFAGTYGRRSAKIWVNPEWAAEATPEELRQTLVHEVIHAHVHPTHEFVAMIATMHPKRTAEVLLGIFNVQQEYAIDALADVIAPFMPLPPEVEA